jgi:hypothetical protein
MGAEYGSGRGKACSDAIAISRVDVLRKLFERNVRAPGDAPKLKPALIHREPVVVDVPCPERRARGLNRYPIMFEAPLMWLGKI